MSYLDFIRMFQDRGEKRRNNLLWRAFLLAGIFNPDNGAYC